MSNKIPFVSIIIPCRNEKKHITNVLTQMLEQNYDTSQIEIIVVDGMSNDGTTQIIDDFCKKYTRIRFFTNPHKIVPHALNLAIKQSKGEYIIRVDAHSDYPENYIQELIKNALKFKADNTGGVWNTLPGSNTGIAKAIAFCTASKFGIGNAQYRLQNDQIKEVDTVPFGCYHKNVFTKIGLFDEDLIRNQDDEFNARLIKNGGKIILLPHVIINYYARENWNKMSKMFYQYAFFKPLVNKKIGTTTSVRQLIPPAFVLVNILFIIATILFPKIGYLFLLFGLLYFTIAILEGIKCNKLFKNKFLVFLCPLTFLIIHFSYGIGYIRGFINFNIRNKTKKNIQLSR